MSSFFLKIYDVLSRHKVLTTIVLFLFIVLCVMMAFRVHYEEDIAKFLPKNVQTEKYTDVYQQVSSQNRIAIIFEERDTSKESNTDSMELAMNLFGEKVAADSLLKHVRNLQVMVNEDKMLSVMDFVYRNAPCYMTENERARIDTLLNNRSYIHQQLVAAKQQLIVSNGMVMQMLQYDPLCLYSPVMQRLRQLQPSSQFQIVDGYVFTRDAKHAMITFDSPYGSSESEHNALLANQLDKLMAQTEAQYPTLHISAIGAPLIAVTNAQQIKTDSLVALAIAVVFILIILVCHYRRISYILWIGISILFGVLFAIVGMSIFYDSVSIIVLGIGSVIIGIAVNYPLHFLDHVKELSSSSEDAKVAMRGLLKELVPPLLIGNITTVAAFLCLIRLDAQAMRDLGAFGSLMLVGTILFVLVFFPLYVKIQKKVSVRDGQNEFKRGRTKFGTEFKISKLSFLKLSVDSPKVLCCVVLITLVLGYFSLRTSFDSNLSHINYMTSDQHHNMELFSASVKKAPLYVVAEGKTLHEAFVQDKKITKVLAQKHIQLNGIGDFVIPESTPYNIEIAKKKRFLRIFDEECRSLGFSKNAFKPFREIIETSQKVHPVSYYQPIITPFMGVYVIQGKSGYRIVNYLNTQTPQQAKAMVNDTSYGFAFDAKDVSSQIVSILNNSFNYVGFVCSFVVFVFLWLSFRRIELAAMSFLPLAIGWIWILGLMQVLGIQFNIVNVILATFIFGQGDDYTIFITEGLLYEYSTGRKRLAGYKRSVLLSATLMFIGIGTLILAKHPALRSLAEVTIVGMSTVVLMAAYLPPLVFKWLVRSQQYGYMVSDGRMRMENGISRIPYPLPYTLKRLINSVGFILFFLIFMYFGALPYTWFYFHFGKITDKKRQHYHLLIQRCNRWALSIIPGLHFTAVNKVGETFEKPAVIICNHQSHLDILAVLQFSPKMVIVTNGWTWNNPFYGSVLHHGDFLPAADGIDKNMHKLCELYQQGYSIVIYPEATRSTDCEIMRFHKGAFYLAHELGADILPLYLHGAGYVLPKKDFMLREGDVRIEVGERVRFERYDDIGLEANEAIRKMALDMRHQYQRKYAEICKEVETDDYLTPYRKLRDYYQM